jgi:hypothetical protein
MEKPNYMTVLAAITISPPECPISAVSVETVQVLTGTDNMEMKTKTVAYQI